MFRVISNILLTTSIVFLFSGGIYFSHKLSFPQFKWKKLLNGFKESDNKVSPFNSLMISLAARIGVGSVAGIALAIFLGGPGTIFWIWIIALITAVNSFVESYLALKYQEVKKECNGGPYYYIEKGLKNKELAIFYALLVIGAYILGFMTIQANTIIVSINNSFPISKVMIALILLIITFFSIEKGLKTVITITSKIVPIMGIAYILLGLIVITKNLDLIPSIISNIIKSAWNIKSITSSFIPTFLIGIKRGIFSTEAGLGTSSIALATTYTKNKLELSYIQILGIYFTVFVVCTITALIILTSNYQNLIIENINGIELIEYALNYHIGSIGNIVLIIMIILLAYSTIVAGYYYGESSYKYLFKKAPISILKLLTLIFLFIGSIIDSLFLWKLVDIIVCILAITNMYALICLRKEVIFDYKNSK